jgi:hypothetical protein
MKTLIHAMLFFCILTSQVFAAPDKLEEKINLIKVAVDQTITSLKFADSKARKCTPNYDSNTVCPKTYKNGYKKEFTDPVLSSFASHKILVDQDLLPLPGIVKKPVDDSSLKQVDSCSDGEMVLKKDFQTRLDALKKGKLALKKITDGSGSLGTKGWYAKLFNHNKNEAKKFQEMSKSCIVEAGYGLLAGLAPKTPYELFRGAFEKDRKNQGCDPGAIIAYDKVAHEKDGTLKIINDASGEVNSVLEENIKKLEAQIALANKRQEGCPTAKEKKKEGEKAPDKKPEEKKPDVKEPDEKEEKKPDTTKVDEKKSTISGDSKDVEEKTSTTGGSENCEASAYTPYGNDGRKNSCYNAAGSAKERSKNLATLRKENPEALEKALIDRDTPEAKALSKQLLDEADAYAKSQNPPLPSPKVSARDSVCGESCVAYLKAKSAEQSGLDAQTVSYLKKKASTTQRRKLQDISY